MAIADTPKYLVIARDLRTRLATGEFAGGQQLPTQQALADQYKVTVMTLRQALAELQDDGLVSAQRGRGTFVTERPLDYRLNHLSSFAQEIAQQGKKLVTKTLGLDVLSSGEDDARRELALDADEALTRIVRLRLVRSRPIVYQTSFLPARLATGLTRRLLGSGSLYDHLNREYGLQVVRAVETLRAVTIRAEEARELERPLGSAALLSIRVSLTLSDKPVLFDRAIMPADTTQVVADRVEDRLRLSYQVR